MSYNRYGGGGGGYQERKVAPWASGGGNGNFGAQNSNLAMNLLGTMMGGSTGGGNMANLASSLVAQALQNKPGGMMIGGHSFGGASSGNSGPPRGGYMDRRGGREDYNRGRDYHANSHRNSSAPRRSGSFRRSRSRSRDRKFDRGSRRDHSDNRNRNAPPVKRMRAGSPKDRAPFEIYIGNYPVRFRESDVRNLFQEHGIEVTTIRLKHDGHKVFAFAETSSEEEIQKAIKGMDSKEIQGRRLRVRSSKDKTHNDKDGQKKMPPRRRELCEDDVTRHLVFAFMGFLGRQAEKEDLEEDKKAKIEQAKETLKEAFEIPDDDTLKVSRNLELIFLQNNRREIPVPVEETKEEENESGAEKEDETAEDAQEEDVEDIEHEEEENEAEEEANDDMQENDEETALIDELGGAIGNLVEENNDEEDEPKEDDDDVEIADEPAKDANTPSARGGGRGRGTPGRARRARGRRGA